MNIVAVTACPTGIAHTYMAAEQLERTARKLGHTIKVETQGSMGLENELSAADIAAAEVDYSRFTARAAGSYQLGVTVPGGGLDPVVGLYTSTGKRIGFNTQASPARAITAP